jgi:beta-lysine 5,6-aminomutase beta subunit
VVTQRDVHRDNARRLVDELTRLGRRQQVILLLGGPRIDHKLALELGYDAGFGPGTRPSDVANYLVGEVLRRLGKERHR